MATYALIHGAGTDSWYWHLVAPELEALGHEVVAPDLPCDDDGAGLSEQERLGVVPDEIDGGHLPALGRPHELVQRLEAYRSDVMTPGGANGGTNR